MLNRTTPSPSPSKSAQALAALMSSPSSRQPMPLDEDDEDEETLQLKLQEIQARIKLKKYQNAKAREQASLDGESGEPAVGLGFASADIHHQTQLSRARERARTPGEDENARPASQNHIQVPASPVRKLQFLQQQKSPSRVFLGIDKGLKARDVSLKRAPSQKGARGSQVSQGGGYLNKSRTSQSLTASSQPSRPLSFNERLASARMDEVSRAERQEKIQRLRTNAFGIGKEEMEGYKQSAVEIPDEPLPVPTFSRDQVLSKAPVASSTHITRSKTVPNLQSQLHGHDSSSVSTSTVQEGNTADGKDEEASSFECYSSLHLSRRILPHNVVARHVSGKKVMNIKDLLRDVKAPDFSLPDIEQDIVVFAVVASKSEPRAHKAAPAKNGIKQEDRGKYLIITLTDLEFELDIFLFNSGFTRFWKLTEGTVVAILNPNVMPPPPGKQDTGRFSLVINSDEDTILEIGSARDLGFCQSVKKDGEMCNAWVNKKKTHFCEFHSNEALRKQRATRVEVNSSGFGGFERHSKYSGGAKDENKKRGNSNYDWETRTQWFASRTHSAADLIDGKDKGPSDKKERAEFVKRSLEAKEKERDMMRKLGKVGDAAGREYMQRAGLKASSSQGPMSSTGRATASWVNDSAEAVRPDAASLGLTGKDRTIHLSPVKRKRPDSSLASSTVGSTMSTTSQSYGWGSNLRDKLSKMKEGENYHHKEGLAPVRKKTRFVTEKGIREAGRESLGMDLSERQVTLEDDDEELVILR